MQSCDESNYPASCVDSSTSDRIINPGFFNESELAVFFELIRQRRPLPVFHGDMWKCFSCGFWSDDFERMASHLLESHKPAPFVDEEDAVEHDLFITNHCDILL
jgi:hypothetical protein